MNVPSKATSSDGTAGADSRGDERENASSHEGRSIILPPIPKRREHGSNAPGRTAYVSTTISRGVVTSARLSSESVQPPDLCAHPNLIGTRP